MSNDFHYSPSVRSDGVNSAQSPASVQQSDDHYSPSAASVAATPNQMPAAAAKHEEGSARMRSKLTAVEYKDFLETLLHPDNCPYTATFGSLGQRYAKALQAVQRKGLTIWNVNYLKTMLHELHAKYEADLILRDSNPTGGASFAILGTPAEEAMERLQRLRDANNKRDANSKSGSAANKPTSRSQLAAAVFGTNEIDVREGSKDSSDKDANLSNAIDQGNLAGSEEDGSRKKQNSTATAPSRKKRGASESSIGALVNKKTAATIAEANASVEKSKSQLQIAQMEFDFKKQKMQAMERRFEAEEKRLDSKEKRLESKDRREEASMNAQQRMLNLQVLKQGQDMGFKFTQEQMEKLLFGALD